MKLLLCVVSVCAPLGSSLAAVHYVNASNPTPLAPYTSWFTAAVTIQEAVDVSAAGDEVVVTNGLYATGGRAVFGTLTNRVALYKAITLRSVNGPQFTTIQGRQLPGTITGDGAVRCVYLTNGANLFGFTLTNGATRKSGDFFEIVGGGFLAPLDSAINVSNCVVVDNSAASQGGGAYTGGRIIRCIFSGNSAVLGGGLYGGSLTSFGAVLNNCIITGNFANDGAGVLSAGMTNCLIVGNVATNSGGGAYESLLNNCTVSKNSASIGGGLYKSLNSYTPCLVYNSVVYDNSSSDSIGGSNHLNCTIWNSCTAPMSSSGQGNITNDPVFINPATGNFRLQSNSICINSGNNAYVNTTTDLDGNPRIAAGIGDMGAYEFQGQPPPTRGTHYVNLNSATPTPPYASWATAATNIQDAIDIALPGAEVVVSNGVYATGGHGAPNSVTNRVEAYKPVTIRSVNGPAVTRIEGWQVPGTTNGNGAIRCAWLASGASLSGFTLTNGATRSEDSAGGGLWCDSTVSVSNCVIINNSANYGGGVSGGTLRDCLVIGNSAVNGAGGAGGSTLVGCVVSFNTAFSAGGCAGCNLTNSMVSSNSATGDGGAADYSVLTRCRILGNSGGVATYGSTLDGCLVAFNSSGGVMGRWNVHQPDPVPIRNCTVTSNKAWGTMWCLLTNSIIIFNGPGNTNNHDGYYFFWYSCTTPLPTNGFGCITNEPLFIDPANGNFRLQSDSPCINAGNNFYVTTSTDLDGNPRIINGTVDMGAYEYQGSSGQIGFHAWLAQYGLPTDGSADYVDSDGDRMNNYQEWRAGTNPTNAASVLRIISAVPSGTNVLLEWQSVAGIGYFVQRGSNLVSAGALASIATNLPGQAGTTSLVDTNGTAARWNFYRVGVQ